ncbi:hypothetical protein BKA69DRAFT_1147150 [Paraphysoderma sedebokerense]|nr:hypothetical protein BKA69DRAFT_1147150 [Paraphysoderma sedebokerense]
MAPLIKLVEELSCEDTSGFDREQFNFMKQIIRRRGSENQPFWVSMNPLADNIIFPRPTDDDGLTHCQYPRLPLPRTVFIPALETNINFNYHILGSFTYNASLDEGFSQITGPVNSVGRLQVIGPEGFSLIADIDDTIRITEVPSMSRSLFNTFCRPFVAPQGMPEFFSAINNTLSTSTSPLQVHYISGSPVELARPLQTFIDATYIPGSLDLRNYEFSFLGPGRNGTQIHKLEAIDLLMDRFPQRKFLMIGDSGEQDPDTYARAFRKWGATRTIQCIFIRQVPGVNNTLERFVQDFQDVPPEKWAVFEDPSELMNLDVLNGQCRPSGQL